MQESRYIIFYIIINYYKTIDFIYQILYNRGKSGILRGCDGMKTIKLNEVATSDVMIERGILERASDLLDLKR